jgi:hypothetical protein
VSADLRRFQSVWLVDAVVHQPDGTPPTPVCMLACEYRTKRWHYLWQDQMLRIKQPPFDIGPTSLFAGYYTPPVLGGFVSLGWPMPVNVLDLYAEFHCRTSGLYMPCGYGLMGALTYYGIPGSNKYGKQSTHVLVQRGGPYTNAEKRTLLAYCRINVNSLVNLFTGMMETPR